MDVRQDTEIDADALRVADRRRIGFLRFGNVHDETDEPLAGSFLLEHGAFHVVGVGNVAVRAESNRADLRESERTEPLARRVIDVEAFVFVRYRPKLAATVPL